MELRQFIYELKSRKVYRTAAVYCAGAWALLQVADILFPVVGLPDWSVTAVLVMAAIGFPLALVLSWVFELSPESQAGAPERVAGDDALHFSRIIELTLILLLCGLVGYLYLGRLSGTGENPAVSRAASPTSIAVLPFDNLSDEKAMSYLGDGIAEEILNLLTRLNELDVASRTSSFHFKGRDLDIQTIGERLNVAHVLEGSVRYAAGRVRVTAQLIEVAGGYHLWSQTYDRELEDILVIQDEIASQVVETLQLLLTSEFQDRMSQNRHIDPVAYEYYLQGRDYLRRPADDTNVRYAVDLFEKAIAQQGNLADAHAGLCDALLKLYSSNLNQDNYTAAEKSCQKALTLDRRATSVYIALGQLYRVSGQYEQAVEEFNTALALGTLGVDAHLGLGKTYLAANQFELAEQHFQSALDLRPRDWNALVQMGNFLYTTGRLEEALPYYRRVAELMPDSPVAFNNLGATYFMLGRFEWASEAWRSSLALLPSGVVFSNMATSLFFLGRFDEAIPVYHQAIEYAPDAYELWGNLGDAYRHSSTGQEMAKPMYRNALKLARKRLAVNSSDGVALAQMGHYSAMLGERDNATDYMEKALQAEPGKMDVQYAVATTRVALGDTEGALAALGRALEAGFPAHIAAADANLSDLQGLPRFATLIDGVNPP